MIWNAIGIDLEWTWIRLELNKSVMNGIGLDGLDCMGIKLDWIGLKSHELNWRNKT